MRIQSGVSSRSKRKSGNYLTPAAIKRQYGLTDTMISELKVDKVWYNADGSTRRLYSPEELKEWILHYRATHSVEDVLALNERAAREANRANQRFSKEYIPRAKRARCRQHKKRWF